MTAPLHDTRDLARRVSNRALVIAASCRALTGAWIGAAAGLAGSLASKLVIVHWPFGGSSEWPSWWPVLAGPVAGVAIGAASALFARWDAWRALREVEARLPLRDRLSSALSLSERSSHDAFVRAAMEDSERLSREIDVRALLPTAGRSWWIAPAFAAILIASGLAVSRWMPSRQADPGRDLIGSQAEAQARDETAARIRALTPIVREATAGVRGASTRELQSLEDVRRELEANRLSAADAASRSAQAVDSAADALEQRSTQQIDEFDRARRRLATAARGHDGPQSASPGDTSKERSETSAIRKALAAGDVASAAAAAEDLAQRAPSLSPEQRREIAEDLERLARAMEQDKSVPTPGESTPRGNNSATNPVQQGRADPATADSRHPPEAGRPAEQSTSNDASDLNASREQSTSSKSQDGIAAPAPVSVPAEQRTANPNERERDGRVPQPTPSNEPVARKGEPSETNPSPDSSEQISRAIKDAAEELRRDTDPKREPESPAPLSKENGAKLPSPTDQIRQQVSRDPRTNDAANAEPRKETKPENERKEDSTPREIDDSPSRKATDADRPEPGPSKRDERTSPEAIDSAKNKGPQRNSAGNESRNDGQRSTSDTTKKSNPGTPERDGSGGGAIQRLAKELQELSRKPGEAQSNSDAARSMRERAREMLEHASPEQRREIERIARQTQRSPKNGQGQTGGSPAELKGAPGDPSRDSFGNPGDSRELSRPERGPGRDPDHNGAGDGEGPATPGSETSMPTQLEESPSRSSPPEGWKTRLVDARPKSTAGPGDGASDRPETVISSWDAPTGTKGQPVQHSQGGPRIAERFRSAAAGAERSVDQQAVPARFGGLVKRVFRRYVERTGPVPAESLGPVLTPDALDASRPK